MKISRLSAALMTSFVTLLAMLVASPDCWAAFVYFDGSTSSDFHDATNWTPESAPGTNLVDIYGIDDGLSATFSGGTTAVYGLRVGSPAKEHQFPSQETRFGRLTMTAGTLEVIGENTLVVGRERENAIFGGDYNKNAIVDAADYTIWRDTLGSTSDLRADGDKNGAIEEADYVFWRDRFGNVVKGGEFIMTGNSTVTSNGVMVGERTKGLFAIGPNAAVEIRYWDTAAEPAQFGGTADLRIGNYGPAYDDFGAEPGLDGDGVMDVQGTVLANAVYLSENGGKGEIRLSGGTVNFNGTLYMDFCGGCTTDPDDLAQRLSKVSIIGSSGTFNIGLDPDPAVVDPEPPDRDLSANSPTAVFSFTADAGGVTPIVVVENADEPSGFANIDTATLVLNLDAYTSASPLTLINAVDGHLSGEFGTVTFLGSRTADVVYDVLSGDVYLDNFQGGAGAGSLAGSAVPEPSGLLLMTLTLVMFMFSFGAAANRPTVRLRGYACPKIRG